MFKLVLHSSPLTIYGVSRLEASNVAHPRYVKVSYQLSYFLSGVKSTDRAFQVEPTKLSFDPFWLTLHRIYPPPPPDREMAGMSSWALPSPVSIQADANGGRKTDWRMTRRKYGYKHSHGRCLELNLLCSRRSSDLTTT